MKRVQRFDAGTLAKPERTPEGWLRAEAHTARTGILEYDGADGKVRRELVTPDELFAPESIASARMVPLTLTHPQSLLDAATARVHAVGSVGENVRPDGDLLAAPIMVTDGAAVKAIEAGTQGMSWGYDCDLDETAGNDPKFGAYDAIQRRRYYNHLAIVEHPRAGAAARIRLDSAGNAEAPFASPAAPVYAATQHPIAAPHKPENVMPAQIRIDAATFPADDANAAAIQAAIDKQRTDAAAKVDAETKRADAAVKRLDAYKARVAISWKSLRGRFDAMKARMVGCDECGGSGKVMNADAEAKCDYCDGKGTIRMHDAIKAMPPPGGEPDGDEPDDMEEMGDALGEMPKDDDVDPGNWAQNAAVHIKTGAEHAEAGSVNSGGGKSFKKGKNQDARRRRADSLARIADRRAKTRAALLTEAGKHLDAADIAGKADAEIRRAVVVKLAPHLDAAIVAKMDGAALDALFTSETKRATVTPSEALTNGMFPAPRADAAAARAKALADADLAMNPWKKPAGQA